MSGSYCLSKKSHISHHIIFITVCAQNVCLHYERKRVDTEAKSPSAHWITVWLRAAHSLLIHHFSSLTPEILVW